jgi:hypothetical protein
MNPPVLCFARVSKMDEFLAALCPEFFNWRSMEINP